MVTRVLVASVAILIAKDIPVTFAHPQCLDFRPPFENSLPLSFCTEYSEFGCCTQDQDNVIEQEYMRVLEQVKKGNIAGCDGYLKDILCQRCSPYAAHIYDAESVGFVSRLFPGLCSKYCLNFFGKCRSTVEWISTEPDLTAAAAKGNETLFCQLAAVSDPNYCYPDLLVNDALNQNITREQRTVPGCLCLEEFASGLGNPLTFRFPPGDDERIFIGEQIGVVHIYFRNKTKLDSPFLDIQDEVLTSSWNGDERGFLGMTFHPDFQNNKKFYVYYSARAKLSERVRISEFTVNSTDPNKVNSTSERIVLEVFEPFSNHNGGEILFGVDGYLYAFIGDGGSGGDPFDYAQNKETLLGKVIRIDVDRKDGDKVYAIPNDNPFINSSAVLPEIFAYGIRNIWRCDVDEGDPVTGHGYGRILCGDVGQSAYEEIDIIVKGGNYGWNTREGYSCYNSRCGQIGPEVLPIHAYDHSQGRSVTGGHVYRGCSNPNLQGQYIYGDFVVGALWSLTENMTTGSWSNKRIDMCGTETCFNGLTGTYQRNILSFGEDQDGELYMLTTNYASPTNKAGRIYRFVDPKRRGDPTKCRTYKAQPEKETTAPPTTTTTTTQTPPGLPSNGKPLIKIKCGNTVGHAGGCKKNCTPVTIWRCWPVLYWT